MTSSPVFGPCSELKDKYSSALHNYFRITNYTEVRDKFLNGEDSYPRFRYPRFLEEKYIDSRLDGIKQDLIKHGKNKDCVGFLRHRQKETHALKLFWQMHRGPFNDTATIEMAEKYAASMEDLFGPVDKLLYDSAMQHVYRLAVSKKLNKSAQTIKDGAYWNKSELFKPMNKDFSYYRNLLKKDSPVLFEVSKWQDLDTNVKSALNRALRLSGLDKKGWSVAVKNSGVNIMVSGIKKQIFITAGYAPKNNLRLRQVIAHEIYGHARRSENKNHNFSQLEEEGIAILLEQLVANRYSHKRLIRFLAVCLASGADGKKRDFIETYKLCVPIAKTVTGETNAAARQTAFSECLRVFRGGNPQVPGAIYTKDKVYFEGNISIWLKLKQNKLNAEQFSEVICGYDTLFK